MEWKSIIPICLAIIGYFGIFWTLNLSNIDVDINLNTDNNTLEILNRTLKYQETLEECEPCICPSRFIWETYGGNITFSNYTILNYCEGCI